jgi:hypothetical protein
MSYVKNEGRADKDAACACPRARGLEARIKSSSNLSKAVRLLPRLHYVGSCDDRRDGGVPKELAAASVGVQRAN